MTFRWSRRINCTTLQGSLTGMDMSLAPTTSNLHHQRCKNYTPPPHKPITVPLTPRLYFLLGIRHSKLDLVVVINSPLKATYRIPSQKMHPSPPPPQSPHHDSPVTTRPPPRSQRVVAKRSTNPIERIPPYVSTSMG